MVEKYSDDLIEAELKKLNKLATISWVIKDQKLSKTFNFSNFIEAFGFMTKVAIYAEKLNHHPEWFNVYKTVTVDLTTHELAGISARDFELARIMEKLSR
ncbi:MAG: 4a-hydroxytetrahydrobiopterin dehydratase [Cycloclasticus sp.]|jgi:4a-hydroxytetrahydrobiopterin dehydratase|nr:4a-hydroxytetrahydrobiopterin dehydratase [Cycloclasticus sp.]